MRQDPEHLKRLSVCIQSICKVRPDTYFLITIQQERLSPRVRKWLKEHQFYYVTPPALTSTQRRELVETGREILEVAIAEQAVTTLAENTDIAKPWDIVSVLQYAPPRNSDCEPLSEEDVQTLLARSEQDIWAEQRREVIQAEPASEPLLRSIVTFVSAGVTPSESNVRRYASYLMRSDVPRRERNRLLNNAAERWRRYDIIASGGLYTIPEPRLMPLIIDTEEARAHLRSFVETYNPGLWVSLVLTVMRPVDAILGRLRLPRLLRFRLASSLQRKLRKITRHLPSWDVGSRLATWLSRSLFSWPADRAVLLRELGSQPTKGRYLSSSALVWKGRSAASAGDHAAALADFDRAIALNPEYAMAIAQRGDTYLLMGKHEQALADFDCAVELDPDYSWAFTQRGLIYQLMERYEEALADFDRVIELDPKDRWAIARRGVTYCYMERYEEALADFDHAIELDPDFAWAFTQRGLTYLLMDHYEEALADLNRAIDLDPDDAWAVASRGGTYLQMGHYEEALADFDRAIELVPDFAWALNSQGVTYACMELYEEALVNFDQVIELDPNYAWVIIANRGRTYLQMEHYEEALADFDRAIELDPNYAWAINSRGVTHVLMGKYEQALADFDRAIELEFDYGWVTIFNRGETCRRMERYEEALADFDRAIDLYPNYAWAIASRGETYRQMGRREQALADFDRAIELDSDNDWYLYERALTNQALGQAGKAQQDLAAAIGHAHEAYGENPEDWINTLNLALYHIAAGESKEAEHLYREAISNGVSPHRIRKAIRDLEDFLALFPDHSHAAAMRDTLQHYLEEIDE